MTKLSGLGCVSHKGRRITDFCYDWPTSIVAVSLVSGKPVGIVIISQQKVGMGDSYPAV